MCGKTKRICAVLVGAVLLCLLSACAVNGNDTDMESQEVDDSAEYELVTKELSSETNSAQSQVGEDASDNQSNSISDKQDEEVQSAIEESYKAILLGGGDFVSTDLHNMELNLENIREAVTDDDSVKVKATKFTIVDLDGNGENEIVLWIQINDISDYGFEVLHYQDEEVYGYTLPYREFMNLKTDGTFLFSGGADDTGIGKLRLSDGGYTIDKLYYSESQYNSNNELKVQYFANGEPCSEDEFNNAMNQQEEKTNVGWYDLTADSVELAFENRF